MADDAILQVQLLAGARGVFQMSRICIGPLVVSMAAEYNYTAFQKGQILGAFAAGYALTQVVGGVVADRLGGAPLLVFGLGTSAGSLILLPWAADTGVGNLCWLLWFMGLTQGPTFPAQLASVSKWASGSLRSYASALGAAGSTAGSLLALGLTPVLAARLGWRITGHVFGVATFLFGALWHFNGRSSPVMSTSQTSSPVLNLVKLRRYCALLLAPPVLVVFVAHSVHNFVRYFLVAWTPTYYADVLKVSADSAGFQQILPESVGLLCSFAGASVGKWLQDTGALSTLGSRRLFATVAFSGASFGLVAVSEMSTGYLVTACLCIVHGLMSLQGLGYGANYLDVSKHHAGLVTGVGNTVATFASFVAPVVASRILASEDYSNEVEQWRYLFLTFASSNLVGLAVYLPFSSVTAVDVWEDAAELEQKKE
mmetsp:Transcript_32315/g.74978  ORF Transcript_32315/g.74978 Transcript_32315/m.74978 type:complete len:427 (-) Transcript_32315:292-1572(-)|eukprot:CAMPEP_0171084630 /NCGR_PEP_ID=MMETSP0766_2-20121228/18430_1 /TAXON_ID=439317 /ORGANISM="Gambierdiscus australes, Strain CAWD 149" /LENGTH=426 /DNA_ID=CAMNT_0011542143 /DNA_START=177 /DNA_END=1457 /DNA_ORIENTATION=+